ncbi:MAG TPA: hypothetical protein PKD45_14425 [Flavobacteriales bacterium]|nr:hypothetical protein [Flavobacteriales bacterium]
MANDQRDFLLDEDGRLVLRNGGIATGNSFTQEVALLMLTNKGELRHDPLAGCDLVRRTNSRLTQSELARLVRVQVERDGKQWSDVMGGLKLNTNA